MKLLERASSEWAFVRGLVGVLRRTMPIGKRPNHTMGDLADELAERYGDRIAIETERETVSYKAWNARANRYARWALGRKLGRGEVVGLMMPNCAEYLSVWVGLAKSGAATALVNTNLSGATLAHALEIVEARLVIVDARLLSQLETALPHMGGPIEIVVHGPAAASEAAEAVARPRLDTLLASLSDAALTPAERPALTIEDRCIFVYTSGTTGMPKAANLNHYRVQLAMHAFAGVTGARPDDRIYDCLPMYHSNGGVVAPGLAFVVGGTCVIRERFSAREFWPDVKRSRCTMFVYIGELCRYLLQTPGDAADRTHAVRLCVGNGLRPDVWLPFRNRFGIRQIREFYASTEGNCSMFNLDSRPEAVGRVPGWAASRFPIKVVRFDVDTEEAVRDADGRCVACGPDEPGEVIGEIVNDPSKPGSRFEGYTDPEATARKVLHDVFRPGDSWFRTGDLMRRDAQGYFYFVDRVGDTFRWKGENVATLQVSETITGYPGIKDAIVYGVSVPGREGRAGMAALVLDETVPFDLDAFKTFLLAHLPVYAVPVFLRLSDHIDVTGTFKQRKLGLAAEGFDPGRIAEPLYFTGTGEPRYRVLDAASLEAIGSGRLRL